MSVQKNRGTVQSQGPSKTQDPRPRYALPLSTPLGPMTLVQRGEALCELRFTDCLLQGDTPGETPLLTRAAQQLGEYFAGRRQTFDLPMELSGTPFQKLVWQKLAQTVPYGQTVSYGELARRCGKPGAARAVGMANHRNPLPILIPCHRVIGTDGSPVGYGGGLPLKVCLLALEAGQPVGA